MTNPLNGPASAITCTAALMVTMAILSLLLGTLPRNIMMDEMMSGSAGIATSVARGASFALNALFSLMPPLLFLSLPLAKRWRLIGAALLLLLMWLGPILTAIVAPYAATVDIRPFDWMFADLSYKLALVSVGTFLTLKASGRKAAMLVGVMSVAFIAIDQTFALPFIQGHWMLWAGVVGALAIGGRSKLPERVLPWIIAWLVILLVPWLLAVVPAIRPALETQIISDRLRALGDAIVAPQTGFEFASLATICAILGVLAALRRRRKARRGDWIAALALGVVTVLFTLVTEPSSRFVLWIRSETLSVALNLLPRLAVLGAAIWLYLRWDKA